MRNERVVSLGLVNLMCLRLVNLRSLYFKWSSGLKLGGEMQFELKLEWDRESERWITKR